MDIKMKMEIEVNNEAGDGVKKIEWKWLAENQTDIIVVNFIMNDGKVYNGEICRNAIKEKHLNSSSGNN